MHKNAEESRENLFEHLQEFSCVVEQNVVTLPSLVFADLFDFNF